MVDGPDGDARVIQRKKSELWECAVSEKILTQLLNERWISSQEKSFHKHTEWSKKLRHICVGRSNSWTISQKFYDHSQQLFSRRNNSQELNFTEAYNNMIPMIADFCGTRMEGETDEKWIGRSWSWLSLRPEVAEMEIILGQER